MMAAFSVLFLWMKLIEWFKIFDATSFYVKLVRETIIEILSFALIFITCLAMFGTFMYFLQLNQTQNGNEIVENKFDHFFLDILYNQFMLSLGEFTMDGFDEHPWKASCYFFFILSTIITQITFFNMLVAIMGETFNKVWSN